MIATAFAIAFVFLCELPQLVFHNADVRMMWCTRPPSYLNVGLHRTSTLVYQDPRLKNCALAYQSHKLNSVNMLHMFINSFKRLKFLTFG